jgi:transcriptional regulator
MYNPAPFVERRPDVLHALIRQNPLGTLVTCGPAGPEASHVPFVPDFDRGVLRCHLARANPHSRMLSGGPEVLVIFRGVDHYVTPSWYPSKQEHGRVVPTWNYIAVHVRGRSRILQESTELLAHLKELTAASEAAFEIPWTLDDAPPDFIAGLTASIVGLEIAIETIEGKYKLSQNRTDRDRAGVIAGLEALGSSTSLEMAAIMRKRRDE